MILLTYSPTACTSVCVCQYVSVYVCVCVVCTESSSTRVVDEHFERSLGSEYLTLLKHPAAPSSAPPPSSSLDSTTVTAHPAPHSSVLGIISFSLTHSVFYYRSSALLGEVIGICHHCPPRLSVTWYNFNKKDL